MSTQSVTQTFPIFNDVDGQPLESGYIYIGTAGLQADTNQIQAYWDADGTVPATQPIRTIGGYPQQSGSPGVIYVTADDYSITVNNKNNSTVYSSLNMTQRVSGDGLTTNVGKTGSVDIPASTKIENVLTLEDFGAVGDGVTDDAAAIQAAIDSIPDGGTIYGTPGKTYAIGSTVEWFNRFVKLDFGNAKVIPLDDINMFELRQGANLVAHNIDTTGITYTQTVIYVNPSNNNDGTIYEQPAVRATVTHAEGANTGTTMHINGTEYWTHGNEYHITAFGGQRNIYLTRGDEQPEYINSNIFNLKANNSVYAIYEDETTGVSPATIRGNIYYVFIENNGNNAELRLFRNALVIGAFWDDCNVTFAGKDNTIIATPGRIDNTIVDNHQNNRVICQDGEYYNGYYKGEFGDWRPKNRLRGVMEFRDFIINGFDSRWAESGTGTTTTAAIQNGDGVTGNYEFLSLYGLLTTGTALNDFRQLDWGTTNFLSIGQELTMHATVSMPTTDATCRIGFLDSNLDGVYLDGDGANNRWIAKCVNNSGADVTSEVISNDPAELTYLTIIASNTKARFILGSSPFGGADIAKGRSIMTDETTITTDLPLSALINPVIWVRTNSGGSAALLRVYDMQIMFNYNRLIP